jgi:glycosyltransferase involved in cell wall biosynthesis
MTQSNPVLFITADITLLGGIERVVVNTANHLSSKGLSTVIVSLFRSHRKPFYAVRKEVEILYLSSIPFSRICYWMLSPFLILANKLQIENRSPRSVMVLYPPFLFFIYAFWNISSRLVVYSEHMSFNAAGPLFALLRKKLLARIGKIQVLNSTSLHEYGKLGISAEVIPNAVTDFNHEAQFRFRDPSNSSNIRSFRVLGVGRLDPVKGFSDTVEIANHLKNQPYISFTIVGDGKEKKNLASMAARYKLSKLSITPASRNIENIYVRHDCILVTSCSETFPMVLLEAMSFGLVPICYSDLDGPKDIVTSNVNGFLVDRGDLGSIAEAILTLSHDHDLVNQLSREAIITARKYSQSEINPRMLDLLVWDKHRCLTT